MSFGKKKKTAPARNRILHRSARTLVSIPATLLRLQNIKLDLQETLRTAPDLCKNISLAVLFGSNHLYTARHIYMYTYASQYGDAGRVKEI